jgi:ankyrin repeat protein
VIETPLHWAASTDYVVGMAVEFLLDAGRRTRWTIANSLWPRRTQPAKDRREQQLLSVNVRVRVFGFGLLGRILVGRGLSNGVSAARASGANARVCPAYATSPHAAASAAARAPLVNICACRTQVVRAASSCVDVVY